jgi:hypothetical protein
MSLEGWLGGGGYSPAATFLLLPWHAESGTLNLELLQPPLESGKSKTVKQYDTSITKQGTVQNKFYLASA